MDLELVACHDISDIYWHAETVCIVLRIYVIYKRSTLTKTRLMYSSEIFSCVDIYHSVHKNVIAMRQ